MSKFVLAIDQGTTSSRAILFDANLRIAGSAQQEFEQLFPASGWVEHRPADIWHSTKAVCNEAMHGLNVTSEDIAAIGITNQRETTVVWDRKTGDCIYNAVVWQDRRTADVCRHLRDAGHEDYITERTGLLLDPYFSGTKLAWILDHVDGARERAEAGELAFGTIDSYLMWQLTDGQVHATDATNASRTMLYDIHTGDWSDKLLEILRVPRGVLPEVRDCASEFGSTETFGGSIPITGVAGDQQAATVGQACFEPGMMKSTYGTGCFALLNTGTTAVRSNNRLLTTVAYRLNGITNYALEGSIFIAGAAVQWLRDGLGVIDSAPQSGELAIDADEAQDVVLVPAFVGLGAPYWDAECRGALFGLTRGTGPREISKAALESVCYQTRDLLDAMRKDWSTESDTVLRVDGGMVASDWTMQCLADILNTPVDRPQTLETTAMGAAWLAGMYVGLYPDQESFGKSWARERRFEPAMDDEVRERKYALWQDAVRRTLSEPKSDKKSSA